MLYLTLRQYEYVCAIGRNGSLSSAAQQLNVSQPALSTALARVEEYLGHPLFIRRRGSAMAVTPQGRKFMDEAETVLNRAARLEDPDHPHQGAGHLCWGCFADLAPFHLAPAVRGLRGALPDLSVTSRTDGFEPLIAALIEGQIDLALTYDLGLDAGFTRLPLYDAHPHALMPPDHPLAQHAKIALADVNGFPVILSEEGLSAQHMLGLFRQRNLSPVVGHRAASLEVMRSLAAHGEGIGLSYVNPSAGMSYDGMPLVSVRLCDPDLSESVILTRHGTGPADPQTEAAIAVLRALFGKTG